MEEPAVEHNAGADASTNGNKDKVAYSLPGTDPALCNGRRVHIVFHRRRNTERGFQQCTQRHIAPTHEIRGGNHYALVHICDARGARRNRAARLRDR